MIYICFWWAFLLRGNCLIKRNEIINGIISGSNNALMESQLFPETLKCGYIEMYFIISLPKCLVCIFLQSLELCWQYFLLISQMKFSCTWWMQDISHMCLFWLGPQTILLGTQRTNIVIYVKCIIKFPITLSSIASLSVI